MFKFVIEDKGKPVLKALHIKILEYGRVMSIIVVILLLEYRWQPISCLLPTMDKQLDSEEEEK